MVGRVVSGAFVLVDWTDSAPSPVVGELFFYPDSIDYLQKMFSGRWYSENTSSLPVALWLLMLFTATSSFYSEISPSKGLLSNQLSTLGRTGNPGPWN